MVLDDVCQFQFHTTPYLERKVITKRKEKTNEKNKTIQKHVYDGARIDECVHSLTQ